MGLLEWSAGHRRSVSSDCCRSPIHDGLCVRQQSDKRRGGMHAFARSARHSPSVLSDGCEANLLQIDGQPCGNPLNPLNSLACTFFARSASHNAQCNVLLYRCEANSFAGVSSQMVPALASQCLATIYACATSCDPYRRSPDLRRLQHLAGNSGTTGTGALTDIFRLIRNPPQAELDSHGDQKTYRSQ